MLKQDDPYDNLRQNDYQFYQKDDKPKESNIYGILAIVFGMLGGLLGLVLGLIGISKYKGADYVGERVMCGIGIFLWACWLIVTLVIMLEYITVIKTLLDISSLM